MLYTISGPIDEHTCDECKKHNGMVIEGEFVAAGWLGLIRGNHHKLTNGESECRCYVQPAPPGVVGAKAGKELREKLLKEMNKCEGYNDMPEKLEKLGLKYVKISEDEITTGMPMAMKKSVESSDNLIHFENGSKILLGDPDNKTVVGMDVSDKITVTEGVKTKDGLDINEVYVAKVNGKWITDNIYIKYRGDSREISVYDSKDKIPLFQIWEDGDIYVRNNLFVGKKEDLFGLILSLLTEEGVIGD